MNRPAKVVDYVPAHCAQTGCVFVYCPLPIRLLPSPFRGRGQRGPGEGPEGAAAPLAVALLLLSLAPAAATAGVIPLDLRFDGQPLEPAAPPDFTCFNATANRWVSCGVKRGEGPGAWLLEGLAPGRYRLHVSIDQNPVNPSRFPGDYEAQHRFEVTERGPERITVDMVRLIHLTRPGDNARSLEGMLTSCATQPVFRDAAPLLGADGADRVRVGPDRRRRRVPGECHRGLVLPAGPPAGGPAHDDGRQRGDPEPAAERGRRAILLLDRGLA